MLRNTLHLVDADTMKHTEAREAGAEWVCLQAIRELGIDRFLAQEGWSEIQVNTALAQLIVRTVYSPSELKSLDIMRENSAVCELLTTSAMPTTCTSRFLNPAPMYCAQRMAAPMEKN